MTLDDLRQLRHEWVESNRKNGFEDGIKRLLTDLYPENAHFIYELLQNAEDTGASVARFTLSEKGLEFEHDGERLFSLKDVESITSIGNSTKRDDPTTVGKFGVGFKAVFAYTNTPEVHSGGFHFRIRDLVVPEVEGVTHMLLGARETRFLFPFDNDKKTAFQSIAEIGRGLCALGDSTLLFLSHIRSIEYLLPDGSLGALRRVDHTDGRIEIQAIHPGKPQVSSHWLRFEKNVNVIDEEKKPKSCGVAIAFSLAELEGKKGNKDWRIVPLERGEVSIYFPAEKETSNLRFHLHAPFASTVARDSVRDCDANNQLRDHLATLLTESLEVIRKQGLLTVSFLSVLPNPTDNLVGNSPFYEPLRLEAIKAFHENNLTPARRGGHAKAGALYRGPSRIAEVLSDEDMQLLTGYAVPLWAANPPPQSQREERFLDSLNIDTWDWSNLSTVLSGENEDDIQSINEWIAQKDDSWLIRFYALLGEGSNVHGEFVSSNMVQIVRVATTEGHAQTYSSEAFFPPGDGTEVPPHIPMVKPEAYSSSRSEQQKRYARAFLEEAGVRPYDTKAKIELLLSSYKFTSTSKKNDATHFEDITLFVSFWKSNPTKIDVFSQKAFILDSQANWRIPQHLYLDSPVLSTGFADAADVLRKVPVAPEYGERLDKSTLADFVNFLKALGVQFRLQVTPIAVWKNPDKHLTEHILGRSTSTRINEDYTISDLEKYLEKKTANASRLIWGAVIAADPRVTTARYRPNREYPTKTAKSLLVHLLRSHAWIPSKNGQFCKPQDLTREDLLDEFPYDDRNGFLTAIGFGENAQKRSAEYQAQAQKRLDLGFESDDALRRAQEFARLPAAEQLRILDEQRQHDVTPEEFPVRPVRQPELRRQRVRGQAAGTPAKETRMQSRAVQVGYSAAKEDARVYLRTQYTNENQVMFCQACRSPLPFQLPSGEYYFEAVDVFTNSTKRFRETFLALCPNHGAMFEHANDGREKFYELIEAAPGSTVEVILAGNQVTIEFTEQHMIDIQACIDSLDDDLMQCDG